MDKMPELKVTVNDEQIIYAGILRKGMVIGFILVIVTFALYVSGIIKPYVPLGDFTIYCMQDAQSYMAKHHIGTGWEWIHLALYGDFMNYIGIVMFTGITIICYISIAPVLLRKRDWILTSIVVAEVALLITASSGLLNF